MAHQISIFLENKIGHFERVTQALREININIRAMTLTHTTNGWGILNLIVSNPEKAHSSLYESGFSIAKREVAAIEMVDQPGGLDDLLKKIAKAEVNFTNAYGRVVNDSGLAYLVIDIEDIPDAKEKLLGQNLTLVEDDTIYGR